MREPPAQQPHLRIRWRSWAFSVAILAVAAFLRFDGLHWDEGILAHPDERFVAMVANDVHGGRLEYTDADPAARSAHETLCRTRNPTTGGAGGWFDTACSDFNPANVGHAVFAYGQLPLTLIRTVADAAAVLGNAPDVRSFANVIAYGRAVSAAADLLTVVVLFLLGRLLWGRTVGQVAAAGYALAVLPVQLAHFLTVDSLATLFGTLALLFAVRLARFGDRLDAVAFGFATALAIATKMSMLPLLALLPLAAWSAPARVEFARPPDLLTRLAVRVPEIVLGLLAAAIVFRIASPYTFVGPQWFDIGLNPAFVEHLQHLRRIAAGTAEIPPNWQWLDRTPWLWPATNLVIWGLSPALGVAAIIGLARRGWRLLRWTPVEQARALAWLWTVGYFTWMGQQWVGTMRYFLPIYPTLCLFAAAWLVPWWRARRQQAPAKPLGPGSWHAKLASRAGLRTAPALLLIGMLAVTSVWSLAFHQIHRTLHTYVATTNWFVRHVPGPVSATLATDRGAPLLVNWPAAGSFGDGVPARSAAATAAPVTGTIDRLVVHRVDRNAVGPTATPDVEDPSVVTARVLDASGQLVATTDRLRIEIPADRMSVHDLVLPLRVPARLVGGQVYQLQVEVTGSGITLSGSSIAQEGPWTDPVPGRAPRVAPGAWLDLAGPSGQTDARGPSVDPFGEGLYVPVDLLMVGDDDEGKRRRLVEGLDRAEWLVVPNNRFYDAMTRNPWRFPLSTRFYDALFAGKLGFERVLTIASPARLGPMVLRDQAIPVDGLPDGWRAALAAEEAFNVYDHPAVLVFKKESGYDRTQVEQELASVETIALDAALRSEKPQGAGRIAWSTFAARIAPDGLLLAKPPADVADGTTDRPSAPDHPNPPDRRNGSDRPGPSDHPGSGDLPVWVIAIAWYLVLFLAGCCAWPWLARLWPDLADRGYGVARVTGLAGIAGTAWWLTWLGVPAWSAGGLGLLFGTAALAALLAGRRIPRTPARPMAPLPAPNATKAHAPLPWRQVVVIEVLCAVLFTAGLLLRVVHPDLWAPTLGGEKPMDYAYFNSVLQATQFPPADPWFSGGRLNYYYFGWVLFGVPAKLLGVAPGVAYNLALATVFALTGCAAFTLTWNAAALDRSANRRRLAVAGGVALVATLLLGNLDLPRAVERNVDAAVSLAQRAGSSSAHANPSADDWRTALTAGAERWFWAPSRTVGERPGSSQEINEFPAFTFLYGDLHPHLMAWPLQLALLTALLAFASAGSRQSATTRFAPVVVIAAGIALLRATNTWDWPLYLLLGCMTVGAVTWQWVTADRVSSPVRFHRNYRIGSVGAAVLSLLVLQALVALPFTASFVTGPVGLSWFDGTRTTLASWLATEGWFVLLIGGWALSLARGTPNSGIGQGTWIQPGHAEPGHAEPGHAQPGHAQPEHAKSLSSRTDADAVVATLKALTALRWAGLGGTVLAATWVAWQGTGHVPAWGLQCALVAWLAELAWRYRNEPMRAAALVAALVGFGLGLATEVIVIGQDIGRMNTYFKLHLQAWMLLAPAAGLAAADLIATGVPERRWRIFGVAMATATLVAVAYVPLALYGRAQTRFEGTRPWTIDGEAFLSDAVYEYRGKRLKLADDRNLIAWLRVNTRPGDILLEAQLPEYRWGSRLSSFTGRPAVLGYRHHQAQQRGMAGLGDAVELRRQNVAAIYATTDADAALRTLHHYGVRYVAVGSLERAEYPAEGLAKFAELARRGAIAEAYRAGDDVVYRVVGAPTSWKAGPW